MRAGSIRHRLVIDYPVETQDQTTGESVTTFAVLANVWGRVEPLRGREALVDGAIRADMDTRITVRWAEPLNVLSPDYRIRHQDSIYNIVSVAHVNYGHREIQIMAKTGTNNG